MRPLTHETGETDAVNASHGMVDIDNWTNMVGKLISSAETLVTVKQSEQKLINDTSGEHIEQYTSETQMEEVQEFFHNCWDDQENEYLTQLEQRPRRSSADHPDHKFIPYLCMRASKAFDAKNYAVAKVSLLKIAKKSVPLYGALYPWRDETLRMLVICCVKLKVWEEAENYIRQSFEGRDQTLEDLAMDFLVRQNKHDAAKVCLGYRFEGREKVMQLLASSYIRERNWIEAKKVLSDLLFTEKPADDIRRQRLHDLAEAYLALREVENAKKCCMNVFNERAEALGESHILYYQSVKLLIRICEKMGESDEVEYYKRMLESDSHGMSVISKANINQSLCRNQAAVQHSCRIIL